MFETKITSIKAPSCESKLS